MFIPELSFDEKAKLGKLISQSVNNSAYTHDVYDYIEELLMKSYEIGCKEGEEKTVCEEEHCDIGNCDAMADEYESGYDAGVQAEKDNHND